MSVATVVFVSKIGSAPVSDPTDRLITGNQELLITMKSKIFAAMILAGATLAAGAQTATKPATAAAKPRTATTASAATAGPKLPPGIPPIKKPAKDFYPQPIKYFYQDEVVGTGALAEAGKLYTIHYTGYFAADGTKFDSSHDHPESPVMGKDGKPELDKDGKPVKAAGQPIQFIQGAGRTVPGFDMGFEGMKVGGKRRIFIPWQLGYGMHGIKSPDPKNHPDINPKTDLIFDVELLDVAEAPARPAQPQMPQGMQGRPGMPPGGARPGMPLRPGQPGQPGQPGSVAVPAGGPGAAPAAGPATQGTQPKANTPAATAPAAAPAATPAPATAPPTAPAAPAKPSN